MKLKYKEVTIYANSFMPKELFNIMEDRNILMMHPYTIGRFILNEFENNTYIDVFNHLGINNNSINACADYALNKIKNELNL